MAAPRADTYSGASGAAIYAGRAAPSGMPAWRSGMAPLTWAVVPMANSLSSVNPETNSALNPNYPAAAPWHGAGGQGAVLDAWCSILPSKTNGMVWIPIGGGHGDYAGNEMYGFDLMQAAPAWTLIRRPSGSKLDAAVTYSDGQEGTGLYSDGRIRATHTYQTMEHVPGRGIYLSDNTANYYSAQGNPRKGFWISESGEHSVACDYSALSMGGDHGSCCHDTVRNIIWFTRANTLSVMGKFSIDTGVVTSAGIVDTWVGGNSRMLYLSGADLIAHMTGIGSGLVLWHPGAEVWKRSVTITGTAPSWVGSASTCGSAWLGGKIWLWNNDSTNTTSFATLTPTGDPWNDPWTWGQVDAAAGNAVSPPARIGGGGGLSDTLGKLGYSPSLKGFVLVPSSGASVYFFATE